MISYIIFHRYSITTQSPNTLKQKKSWFKVDDVTSLAKEDENKWQQIAIAHAKCSKRKTTESGNFNIDFKVGRTTIADISLLDASIDQWTPFHS